MSNGNAEQPTAQAPRGHSSPNRVEVSEEGRQERCPERAVRRAHGQGTEPVRSNGKPRTNATRRPPEQAHQPTTSRAGAWSALVRQASVRPAAPRRSAGRAPAAAQQTPQKQAPAQPTQQKQGQPHRRVSRSKCSRRRLSHDRNRRPAAKPRALPPQTQPRTQSPPTPGTPGARPAPGAVPVWDPPPPPAPKQSLWARLGFGRKAERPEGNPAAPPATAAPGSVPRSRRQPHPVG